MRSRIATRVVLTAVALTVTGFGLEPLGAQEKQVFSPAVQAMREAASRAGVPDAQLPLATAEESRVNKVRLEPWEEKIDVAVRERLRVLDAENLLEPARAHIAPAYSTDLVVIDDRARLRVELKVVVDSRFDEAFFQSIGGELVVRASGYGHVVGWIPATQFERLARRHDVLLIVPVYPPFTDIGAVTTEGDAIHRADDARLLHGVDGTGELIGAISDGVANLAASQASGDLPAGVDVPPGCTGGGDEGTAMLEIVYDLAPGADLAFCTGFPGVAGMINAINTLAGLPGISAITDDLPKPGEPLFEDGPIAQAKQAASAAGIFYTASAGNRGNQHHEADFNSPNANVQVGPNTYANPHDFGGGDVTLNLTLGGSNSLFLQWADPFGASTIDLDLFVVDAAGNILASSTNTQNGTQDPNESVSFNATAGTTGQIIVDYIGGGAPPTVFFDLRGFAGMSNWEYLIRDGSVNAASRQIEVYAAAAANQATPGTIRSFSSRGPIQHFFPGPLTRMKPDGTAVDNVLITGAGGFGGGTCPIVNPGDVCRFSGTSASTPHVAGMTALLLEAEPGLTPPNVADALNSSAVDIDLPGPDNNAGFGRLDVFAAICLFDDVPPEITCPNDVTVECSAPGGAPATDPDIAAFLASASATDICDSDPEITNDAPGFFPNGQSTVVNFTATDELLNSASCASSVTVEDTTAPIVTEPLMVSPAVLWPPNHKLVSIAVNEIAFEDACDPDPSLFCSVESNEPPNGSGDGNTPFDVVFDGVPIFTQGTGPIQIASAGGAGTFELELRAERSGSGSGRTYTIECFAVDAEGHPSAATVATVDVPHSS